MPLVGVGFRSKRGVQRRYNINFNQIYLSKPTVREADGTVTPLTPNEARQRNLTYSAYLYVDVTKKVQKAASDPHPETGEIDWVDDEDESEAAESEDKIPLGKVRSSRPTRPSLTAK
jgi:DNA-directed RNA polymerase II subunit RPB2